MPTTNEPSSASQGDAPHSTDELTAAAVLRDDTLDRPVGGGGLGTPGGSTGVGAATANSPIDAALPHDGGDALAEAEARRQATSNPPAEPGHASR